MSDYFLGVGLRSLRRVSPFAWILIGLFSLLALFRLALLLTNHIPMGHDTFQYMQLQYVMFNEAALTGWLPYWLPFMTHGQTSNIWFLGNLGLFSSFILPLAPLFRDVNYLVFFHGGLLFDEFILLLGCLFLARYYYSSLASVFFVTVSIVFSAISVSQIYWDLHFFYLYPLIIYSLHRFVDSASIKHLVFAGILGAATLLGALPYFMPITLLTIFLYWGAWLLTVGVDLQPVKRLWAERRGALMAGLLPPLILGAAPALWLFLGTSEIIHSNAGRTASGQVATPGEFLSYGGFLGYSKYLQIAGRLTNTIDTTLYSGLLVLPFALVALLTVRSRKSIVVGITALVFGSLAVGSYLALTYFYVFPLARYFRHVGALAVVGMPFLVFYAGFGFEAFWRSLRQGWLPSRSHSPFLIALTPLIALAVLGLALTLERTGVARLFDYSRFTEYVFANQLYVTRAQIEQGLTAVILLLIAMLVALTCFVRWPRVGLFAGLVLTLHLVDVASYKAEQEFLRSAGVPSAITELFSVSHYPFADRRSQDYFNNARFATLAEYLLLPESVLPRDTSSPMAGVGRYGAVYWNTESMVFFDAQSSVFRTDFQLEGPELFYRTWVPPEDRLSLRHVGFPIPNSETYRKLSGYEYPKLQVFSHLRVLPSQEAVAKALRSDNLSGDVLLTSEEEIHGLAAAPLASSSIDTFAESATTTLNDRISGAKVSVDHFDFNSLRVQVTNPSQGEGVLYYADAFHPFWTASVSGQAKPVIRTNLGYKSVVIPPGDSLVEFRFGGIAHHVLVAMCLALGIIASIVVGWLAVEELRRREARVPEPQPVGAVVPGWLLGHLPVPPAGALGKAVLAFGVFYLAVVLPVFELAKAYFLELGASIGLENLLFPPLMLLAFGGCVAATVGWRSAHQDEASYISRLLGLFLPISALFVGAALALVPGYPVLLAAIPLLFALACAASLWASRPLLVRGSRLVTLGVACYALFGQSACVVPASCTPLVTFRSLVVEGYHGYNIIAEANPQLLFYGIRQDDGVFSRQRFLAGAYDEPVVGSTLGEVLTAVEAKGLGPTDSQLVMEGHLNYNIIYARGKFYGVQQADGSFHPARYDPDRYHRLFVGASLPDIIEMIAGDLPQLVLEGYAGYNIILHMGRFYGVRQADGAFDPRSYDPSRYSGLVTGTGPIELFQEIARQRRF